MWYDKISATAHVRRPSPKEGSFVKRTLTVLIALLLCLGLLTGCRESDPPALEEIYDEAVALIEASYAVNDAVFGYGLPVWSIDEEHSHLAGIYRDSDSAAYERVTDRTPYLSAGELREAMEAVYSADYVESLGETLFDGFVVGSTVVRAQLYESEDGLYQSADREVLIPRQRIYDYATMRVVKPSNAHFVTLAIESRLPGEQETLTVHLSLILEDDGWRLDTPTY